MSALPLAVWGHFPRVRVVHYTPTLAPIHPLASTYARNVQPHTVIAPGFESGKLTVTERGPNDSGPHNLRDEARWYCDCKCGAKRVLKHAKNLRSRSVKYCRRTCPLRTVDNRRKLAKEGE